MPKMDMVFWVDQGLELPSINVLTVVLLVLGLQLPLLPIVLKPVLVIC